MSFKTEMGEQIVPGDPVWVMTTCSHYSSMCPGEFVSVNPNGNVQCRVEGYGYQYVNKETGKVGWDRTVNLDLMELRQFKSSRITTLKLNRIFKRIV